MKTSHVCPFNMKVHINYEHINVCYNSTHFWLTQDTGTLRLFEMKIGIKLQVNSNSINHYNVLLITYNNFFTVKLSLGVPVSRILEDV